MLRIDPARPPLWRTATSLQFGTDPDVVLNDPPAWQQRLIRELERGIPDDAVVAFAVALGATSRAAREFVALLDEVVAGPAPRTRRVIVQGAGDVPPSQLDAVAEALGAAGCDVAAAHPFDPPGGGAAGGAAAGGAAVVVVAHHLVSPAFATALMADDRPHLPLVLTAAGAEVGPYVEPGITACLSCLAAHRREADPAWPAIAAQLLGRPVVDVDRSIVWEAGIVAARLLSETVDSPRRVRTRSLILRSGSLRRTVRKHRPHEECRCRSLAGTSTAVVPVRLAPTSPRAFARPA